MAEEKNEVLDAESQVGAFFSNLKRNNKQIKEDRAQQIDEDVNLSYKRLVEDINMEIRKLTRKREAAMDLNPSTTQSLKMEEIDPKQFVDEDLKDSVSIRNLTIKLDVALERYKYLFGKELKLD